MLGRSRAGAETEQALVFSSRANRIPRISWTEPGRWVKEFLVLIGAHYCDLVRLGVRD